MDSSLDMAGKTVNSLTITAGSTFQLGVDVSGYEFVEWSESSGFATVDQNGNVTGVSAGKTTITATVIKDGVRVSIETLVEVKESLMVEGATAIPVLFYIENDYNTSAYYSMFLSSKSTTGAMEGYELVKVSTGQVIYLERPAGVAFGCVWTSTPDENYALAFMSATNSNGNYHPLKDSDGTLASGTVVSGGIAYYYQSAPYNNIATSAGTTWSTGMENLLYKAIGTGYECDGAQSFSRSSTDSSVLYSSLSFISEPLPEVSKTVNGILPVNAAYDEDDENSVKYLRADFQTYQEGMVAILDELLIVRQPEDATAALNEEMAVSLSAIGEDLQYQWYWQNAGDEEFQKSSCKTDTYYTAMTKARAGREIYCVITDAVGSQITSDTVTLIRVAAIELAIVSQPVDASAALNGDMAVSLEAVGEGLQYQWYWRNAGEEEFQKSSCKTDTYYTTMTSARNGREIYCVITDALGSQVVSEVVALTMVTE